MTNPIQPQPSNPSLNQTTLKQVIQRAWSTNTGLTALIVFSLILIIWSIMGLVIDPRTTAILGTPTWVKTFKFSISTLLYGATLLWAITLVEGRARRIANSAANAVGWILVLELVTLVIQGARARPMHFNYTTTFDLIIWQIMTIGIFTMLIAFIVLSINVWRGINTTPILAWAVRLGLIVTVLGLMQGMFMTGPNAAQLESLKSGAAASMIGAHTVGSSSLTPDNGPGLPLVGWSTVHGDLRIGHFVGIHALQLIPLLGIFLAGRRERWLLEGHRIGLLLIAAISYLGLIGLFTWQALRGQSIIAPDAATITAFLGLAAITLVSSLIVIAHARTTRKVIA
jgi:hypothetical protein